MPCQGELEEGEGRAEEERRRGAEEEEKEGGAQPVSTSDPTAEECQAERLYYVCRYIDGWRGQVKCLRRPTLLQEGERERKNMSWPVTSATA